MDFNKISVLGAYATAFLDSASARGELTPASAQTLLNGLIELYHGGETPRFTSPGLLNAGPPVQTAPGPPVDLGNPDVLLRITEELQRRQQAIVDSAAKA